MKGKLSWLRSPASCVALAESLQCLHQTLKEDNTGFNFKFNRSRSNLNAHKLIATIKSNSGFFPKKQLEEKMKQWPSGSYLVMEMTCPGSGICFYAIGYKYNARKVLCFIITVNAGSTIPTKDSSYTTRFPDNHGNGFQRRVVRPGILGIYFCHSNIIDVLNQMWQDLLGLEKLWITRNLWQCGQFTIPGITAIDCMR
jgi:hypothetical protein